MYQTAIFLFLDESKASIKMTEQEGSCSSDEAPSPIATVNSDSTNNNNNDSQNGGGNTTTAAEDGPPVAEIVDHSMDENAKEQGLKLKEAGNKELVAGHFLEAIRLYSEALEYTPTSAIILSNRAQAYIKVENYGLAVSDSTAAIESDATYVKGYWRRATAYFALNKFKLARKDFKQVCKLKPKDRDARAKLAACEKAVREAAFASAIESEATAPLSSTYKPNDIVLEPSTYDGPHPGPDGLTTDMELEESFFQPGKLSRDFVMVRFCMSMFWNPSSRYMSWRNLTSLFLC